MKATVPIIAGIGALLILTLTVSVSAQMGQGNQFWGDVEVNGVPAPDDVFIEAYINGEFIVAKTTLNGQYGIDPNVFIVSESLGDYFVGETIEFFVGGIKAAEAIFESAAEFPIIKELNLSVTGDVGVCGDSYCGSGESCSSCSSDCGSCPPPPDTGGGDTSGGGGPPPRKQCEDFKDNDDDGLVDMDDPGCEDSKDNDESNDQPENDTVAPPEPESCVEDWDCTDWFGCYRGEEERICVDRNQCETEENKPPETQECEVPDTGGTTEQETQSPWEAFLNFFGFTGFAAGDESPGNAAVPFAVAAVIIIVLGGLIYWKARPTVGKGRKKKK